MNKRKAPNGMYWCNITLENGRGKCVMAESLEYGIYRAWSNSSLIKDTKHWIASEDKEGWYYCDVLEEELTFFDF